MKFSDKPKTMIPKGVATLLPDGAAQRRLIEKEILSSFSRWGYQEVIPPIFEYLDVFSLGVGEETVDSAYKFVDRATGRIMVLRPDVTPQIARMASTLLADQPRPLRLCYSANIFRHQEEHVGRERELFQLGGELIGPSDAESDAEMISLTIEILNRLGLKNFRITLGHMAFTQGLLRPFMSSPDFFKQLLHSVSKKETAALERLLKQEAVEEKTQREVLSLLDLFGGVEVLTRAKTLTDDSACRKAIARLEQVYNILKSYGYQDYLLIDLGEVRGFDYYTGTIFEIFSEGVGAELGGGGRYDHLLEKFGRPSASTGFALYIERIQAALEHLDLKSGKQPVIDLMVSHLPEERNRAIALTAELRHAGFRTIRQGVLSADAQLSVSDAEAQKVSKVVFLQAEVASSSVNLIDVSSGDVQNLSQEALITWLQANGSIS